MSDPSASIPPSPEAIDVLTGVHAQAVDNAENLRTLWLSLKDSRFRDMVYDVACRLHQAADMLDAVGTIVAHTNRFQNLRSTDPKLVDWHEAAITAPAPVPALPEGGSGL